MNKIWWQSYRRDLVFKKKLHLNSSIAGQSKNMCKPLKSGLGKVRSAGRMGHMRPAKHLYVAREPFLTFFKCINRYISKFFYALKMPLNILLFKRLIKKHCFVNKFGLRVLIVARVDQICLQCGPREQKELPTPVLSANS